MTKFAAVVAFGFPISAALSGQHSFSRDVPEKKLTIEIRDIDRIHINNMNVFESRQGQVF